MSVIENYPALRPSLLLDFVNSGRVHPLLQCVRASTATCVGADGRLRTVAAHVPRIDYDPATGACLGVLIEEARTNLALYSEGIRVVAGAWSATRCSLDVVAGVTPPPGISAVSQMIPDGTGAPYFSCLTASAAIGASISATFFLKSGGAESCQMDFITAAGFSNIRCNLNFSSGTYFVGSGGSAIVKRLADGWYKVSIYGVALDSNINSLRVSNPNSTQGSGNSVYVTGAQVEPGASPTSYIPTGTSAVTRAAESLSLPQQTLTAPYAVVCESDDAKGVLWQVGATSANRVFVESRPSDSALRAIAAVGGVTQYGSSFAGKPTKSVLAFRDSQYILGRAETELTKSAQGLLTPNVTGLFIGSSGSLASQVNGHIRRLAIYSGALTDQQIQRLRA